MMRKSFTNENRRLYLISHLTITFSHYQRYDLKSLVVLLSGRQDSVLTCCFIRCLLLCQCVLEHKFDYAESYLPAIFQEILGNPSAVDISTGRALKVS